MSQNDAERAVECTLSDDAESDRAGAVKALLVAYYTGYEQDEDGITVRFDGTDEALRAVARFASDELQCCSFAEYEIAVSPPYEETILRITGPEGTRQLFREGLVDRLETASG